MFKMTFRAPEICFLILILQQTIRCSVVVEKSHQDGVYISDYCPQIHDCLEGSHVMCMYYNPNQVMGVRCHKGTNVTLTSEIVHRILEITNEMRSKVALGEETGKDDVILPRGYGIFRLQWDSELATFAQVLANQCNMMHDYCRATTKFPNPGQAVGVVRFSYPNWQAIGVTNFKEPGLTQKKIMYALTQTLKGWYFRKQYVEAEMIHNMPNFSDYKMNRNGRLYVEMLNGPSTHIGCGISAYAEYQSQSQESVDVSYNVILIICNFSTRPEPGKPVYMTQPPTSPGYTKNCGCPPGSDEDEDCLCYYKTLTHENEFCSQLNCKPAVVLLPIFTVENAPPEKLITRNETRKNWVEKYSQKNIFDVFRTPELNPTENIHHLVRNQYISTVPTNIRRGLVNIIKDVTPPSILRNITTRKKIIADVRKRFFSKPKHLNKQKQIHTKKCSIFSKVPTFDLSYKNSNTIKKDVMARKDFSNLKKIVEDYIIQKRNRVHENPSPIISNNSLNQYDKHAKAETYLKSAEEKVMNNYYRRTTQSNITRLSHTPSFSNIEFRTSNEKSNDKLMHILDRLEQEVKHIELDRDKKDIFNAKIRKIYGTLLGNPGDLPSSRFHSDFEINNGIYTTSYDNHCERGNTEHCNNKPYHGINDIERYSNNINTHTRRYNKHDSQLIKRDQYSLLFNDRSQEHSENAKNTKSYSKISQRQIDKNKYKDFYTDYGDKTKTINLHNIDNKRRVSDIERKNLIDNENILSPDRRKYYQEKIANINRKLKTRHNHSKQNSDINLRPILSATHQEPLEHERKQLDPLYLTRIVNDRARFLRGF